MVIADRSMVVQPTQAVMAEWVDVDACVLGCRERMDLGAVEAKYRALLQLGGADQWPPIVGHWRADGRFSVDDGRHSFVAALCLGRRRVFACWLVEVRGEEVRHD